MLLAEILIRLFDKECFFSGGGITWFSGGKGRGINRPCFWLHAGKIVNNTLNAWQESCWPVNMFNLASRNDS